MSNFEKSDLVSDTMVSMTMEGVDELLLKIIPLGPEMVFESMRLMLAAAAWDIDILTQMFKFMSVLVLEGPQAMDNDIMATAVFAGVPIPK